MKDYKEAIESIMKDTTRKVMDHAIKAYRQGYEDGQKEKPQAIYEMKVEEYNKGLNEAWECAKKLCQSEKYGGLQEHCAEIFGRVDVFDVFDYSASQCIEKVKAYEERKKCENCKRTKDPIFYGHCVGECDYAKQTEDEIKVGYEVYNIDRKNKRIVTAIDGNKAIQLCSNGKYTVDNIDTLHWTGREDLRIKKVLEKITNEV